MIKIGDRIPSVNIRQVTESGAQEVNTTDFFKGKRVALFAVPGAFTSVCSAKHLPSFATNADAFAKRGVDVIACISVNDPAVMRAWGEHSDTTGKVSMLADGNGDFARALGAEADMTKNGMGKRSRRYSMLVEDGVVQQFNLEEPGAFGASSGDRLLTQL
ncbi:MAG TPA: peroxiredoxin [Micropepsaceae bacterium]